MAEKTTKKAVKKKRWYRVLASPEFKNAEIGETPASEPGEIVGRIFKVNLMTLTRDMKKQNLSVFFKVREIKGSEAVSELISYEMAAVNVKRLVKKAKDKIDDSFVCTAKDGVKFRIKPLILTRNHTQRNIQTALRKATRDFVEAEAKNLIFGEIVLKVMQNELQKAIKSAIKKVYPPGMVEIRVLKRL